jgi:branched-chain amino acid transport system substrate-binding protein
MVGKFHTLLVTLIFCFLIASCSESEKTQPECLKIGVVCPVSDLDQPFSDGKVALKTAELIAEDLNTRGGIDIGGRRIPIKLFSSDNKMQVEETLIAVRDLINHKGVSALIGPYTSRNAIPASKLCEKSQVPMITPTSTHPSVTEGKKYIFRVCIEDTFQSESLADFAYSAGKRKAAVIFDAANEYSKYLSKVFCSEFKKLGGKIIFKENYLTGEKNFSDIIFKAADSGSDLLFLPNFSEDSSNQISAAKKAGFKGMILGSDAWYSEPLLLNPDAEGTYFSSNVSPDQMKGEGGKFIKRLNDKYGVDAAKTDFSLTTYDAMSLLFDAVKRAESTDPDRIRQALSRSRIFHGITGKFVYTEASGNPKRNVWIMKIEEGKVRLFKEIKPQP